MPQFMSIILLSFHTWCDAMTRGIQQEKEGAFHRWLLMQIDACKFKWEDMVAAKLMGIVMSLGQSSVIIIILTLRGFHGAYIAHMNNQHTWITMFILCSLLQWCKNKIEHAMHEIKLHTGKPIVNWSSRENGVQSELWLEYPIHEWSDQPIEKLLLSSHQSYKVIHCSVNLPIRLMLLELLIGLTKSQLWLGTDLRHLYKLYFVLDGWSLIRDDFINIFIEKLSHYWLVVETLSQF